MAYSLIILTAVLMTVSCAPQFTYTRGISRPFYSAYRHVDATHIPVALTAQSPLAYNSVAAGQVPLSVAAGQVPVSVAAARSAAVDPQYDPNPQYTFSYNVDDPETGDAKTQEETRNGDVVQGKYSVIESDGSRRIVEYSADPVSGFNAVVHREIGAAPPPPAVARSAYQPVAVPGARYVRPAYNPVPAVQYNSAPITYSEIPAVRYAQPLADNSGAAHTSFTAPFANYAY